MSVAVLFGLNYPGTSSELRGCANDVENMARYIQDKYKTVHKYTDIDPATRQHTTRRGIVRTLIRLAREARENHTKDVFIHYSGHGSYVRDRNGDEADGRDEALVPSDYQTAGLLIDDEIKLVLSRFPAFCRVVMVMDCCHSGTIADLSYRCVDPSKPVVYTNKKPIRCKCIMISGCMDAQTSADAYNMKNQGKFSGALTTTLLDVLPHHKKAKDIQREVQRLLHERRYSQVPQICASFDFENENFLD